jgi:hypothetical protein
MKIRKLAALLLTITLGIGASQAALAGPLCPTSDGDSFDPVNTNEATPLLKILCGEIASAKYLGKNGVREETRLTGKSGLANEKEHAGKTLDAIKKVDDIIVKVTDLQTPTRGSKPKIDFDDADDIIAAAWDARYCLDGNGDCAPTP